MEPTAFASKMEDLNLVRTEDLMNDIKLNAERTELRRPIKLQFGAKGDNDDQPADDRTVYITNISKYLPILPQELNDSMAPNQMTRKHLKPSFNDLLTRI